MLSVKQLEPLNEKVSGSNPPKYIFQTGRMYSIFVSISTNNCLFCQFFVSQGRASFVFEQHSCDLVTSPQSCHPLNVIPGEMFDPDHGAHTLFVTCPLVTLDLRLVLLVLFIFIFFIFIENHKSLPCIPPSRYRQFLIPPGHCIQHSCDST